MMIRRDLLAGEIARSGHTKASVAKAIGITPKTFYLKEKTGVFGRDEIVKIVEVCNISNPMQIFFPEFVAQQET